MGVAKVVSVKVPGWLAEALRRAARARRVSVSELVREAVEEELLRSPPASLEAPRSVHELVDEIITLKMPGALVEELDRLRGRYGVRRSVLIREAVWRRLQRLGVLRADPPPEPKIIAILS